MRDTAQWRELQEGEHWVVSGWAELPFLVRTMVCVDKHLTYGKRITGTVLRRIKVNADKGARHGPCAGQEKWSALLNVSCELVAYWILLQVRSVVANAYGNGRLTATTARGTKVNANQLQSQI